MVEGPATVLVVMTVMLAGDDTSGIDDEGEFCLVSGGVFCDIERTATEGIGCNETDMEAERKGKTTTRLIGR